MESFIPIKRKILSHSVFNKSQVALSKKDAFLDLLQKAKFKPKVEPFYIKNKVVQLGFGDVAVSLRYLASAWGWSTSKVRRNLELWLEFELITTSTQNGVMIINVCNAIITPKNQNPPNPKSENTPSPHQARWQEIKNTVQDKNELRIAFADFAKSVLNTSTIQQDYCKILFIPPDRSDIFERCIDMFITEKNVLYTSQKKDFEVQELIFHFLNSAKYAKNIVKKMLAEIPQTQKHFNKNPLTQPI